MTGCPLFPFAKTVPYNHGDRDDWLSKRRIGGSSAACIMGADPYKQPFTLWCEMTGRVEAEDISGKAVVKAGNALEAGILAMAAEEIGLPSVTSKGTLYVHPELDFMTASIDGALWTGNPPAEGVECKNHGWQVKDQFGPSGSELYPERHYWQCQHYMAVTGAYVWHLAALLGGNDLRLYRIGRDEDCIHQLIESEREFWWRVQNDQAPELDLSANDALPAVRAKWKGNTLPQIILPATAMELITEYERVKADIKGFEDHAKLLRAQIEDMMQGAQVGRVADSDATVRLTPIKRKQYNVPKDIKEQYMVEVETEPRLTISMGKDK